MPISSATVLASFLTRHAPASFCFSCLAVHTSSSVRDVRTTLGRLRLEIVVADRRNSPCASCDRQSTTFGFVPKDALDPEAAIASFLETVAHQAACQTCLARRIGLDPYALQTGAARLRAARAAHVAPGTCGLCAQPRLLVRLARRKIA
jgi:hypothetical protein